MLTYFDAVDPAEMDELRRHFGVVALAEKRLEVDTPFLDGKHQLLTSDGRRAEICYVLHRGDPQDGVLLHRKIFYPPDAYRLPTGGIHQGEAVLETLAREIAEETSFFLDLSAYNLQQERPAAGVTVVTLDSFLGTVTYEMPHRSQGKIHRFATYHFLIAAPPNAIPVVDDPEENLAGWDWQPVNALHEIADRLERVGAGYPEWGDWGRFRALSHRFVAGGMRGESKIRRDLAHLSSTDSA
jgi:8-oxo-dGTP pyrophosphatase MutT (NUDIX family)